MRIGIVGAEMIGSTLAKLWSEAGHEARLASRHPEHLKDLVFSSARRMEYPQFSLAQTLDALERLGLDESEIAKIRYTNALRLLSK